MIGQYSVAADPGIINLQAAVTREYRRPAGLRCDIISIGMRVADCQNICTGRSAVTEPGRIGLGELTGQALTQVRIRGFVRRIAHRVRCKDAQSDFGDQDTEHNRYQQENEI
jgi:hypothetical protein